MKKISVAFEPGGRSTLAWAAELARAGHVPLEIVHVFEPSSAEVSPGRYDDLVREREEEIERLTTAVAGTPTAPAAHDLDIDVVVLEGHEPLDEFAHHLDAFPGGLGVIGAHGTHRVGGLGFGFPGYSLLHQTAEPIAMVHPDHEPLVGGVVVVGVDGSDANAVAVAWAERFTAMIGGSMHAVFAYSPIDDTFNLPEGWHRHSDDARAVIDTVTSVPVELELAPGHPSEVLIDHARRVRAAAVVVGTRGLGGFDGLVLGRVPGQLVAHCTAPLIVVPH